MSDVVQSSAQFPKKQHGCALLLFLLIPRFWEVSAFCNTFTKVTHVSFQNTHFLYFMRYMPHILLGFAPYFVLKCPFSCPVFFTFSPLRIIGHYAGLDVCGGMGDLDNLGGLDVLSSHVGCVIWVV